MNRSSIDRLFRRQKHTLGLGVILASTLFAGSVLAATTDFIANPDFEAKDAEFSLPLNWGLQPEWGNTLWGVIADSVTFHGGKHSVRIEKLRATGAADTVNPSCHVWQEVLDIPSLPGKTLHISAWVKTQLVSPTGLNIIFHSGKNVPPPVYWTDVGWAGIVTGGTQDWQMVEANVPLSADMTTLILRIWLPEGTEVGGKAWVDDITITDPTSGVVLFPQHSRNTNIRMNGTRVSFGTATPYTLSVLDANGRVVQGTSGYGANAELSTGNLANGIYILKASSPAGRASGSFVLRR